MRTKVFIEKMSEDKKSLCNQFIRSFSSLNIVDDFRRANSIFIKPNLTYPEYKKGVVTRIEFIESLVSTLVKINSLIKIYIGEGEGGYNSFSIGEAFKNMGYFDLEKKFPQIKVINLSEIPSKEIEIDTTRGQYRINLPEIFFHNIDFSISCPVPKVHCMTKVTLSYKNQWGCLPDAMRLKNHYMFNNIIFMISDVLKFKYAFLDGKYGLDDNGPMIGRPVETNWFLASNSLGAFDLIVSEMMGFDWKKIAHLREAAKYGFIPRRKDITIIGDIDSLKRKFKLHRTLWNYPTFFAFHSKKLTYLFYFSKFAKPLHDIMYTFRKRPLDG